MTYPYPCPSGQVPVVEYDAVQSSPYRENVTRELYLATVEDGIATADFPAWTSSVEDGIATADFPAWTSSNATPASLRESSAFQGNLRVYIFSNQFSQLTAGGNFYLTYPSRMHSQPQAAQHIEAIAFELESALEYVEKQINLPYNCRDTQSTPIQVSIFPFEQSRIPIAGRITSRNPTAWAYASFSPISRNRDVLEFNTRMFNQPDSLSQVKATAQHEVFHLIQSCYGSPFRSDPYWLAEASSVWLEFAMGGDNFWPSEVADYRLAFINNGLFRANDSQLGSWEQHGYASSLFLRYMTDTAGFGNNFMRNMWLNFDTYDPERIFYQAAGQDLLWPRYWGQFIETLYGSTFWANRSILNPEWDWYTVIDSTASSTHRFMISSASTSKRNYGFTSHPLSAQPILVRVGATAFSDDDKAMLAIRPKGLGDNMKVALFNANGQMVATAENNEIITFDDLQQLSAGDLNQRERALAVVLIDSREPSAPARDITVELEVIPESEFSFEISNTVPFSNVDTSIHFSASGYFDIATEDPDKVRIETDVLPGGGVVVYLYAPINSQVTAHASLSAYPLDFTGGADDALLTWRIEDFEANLHPYYAEIKSQTYDRVDFESTPLGGDGYQGRFMIGSLRMEGRLWYDRWRINPDTGQREHYREERGAGLHNESTATIWWIAEDWDEQ
ncbi:hypothetical protein [Desulfurispira natronophila]|uniref:Uncharacterized protein n=1 Tax=Desulfurispira natronophila TaxID=682562 RepID=A0A7W8DH09_9BACT|nr:hypothetical protein [Desulfurispira natronophila]MBB5021902.1 hypothetical protein [Desulfurispira natronophila]